MDDTDFSDPLIRRLASGEAAAPPPADFADPALAALAVPALMAERPQDAVKTALTHRLPADALAGATPEVKDAYGRELRLEQERDRFRGAQESGYGFVARRSLPVASAVFNKNEEQDYADAAKRFREGSPEEGDYAKIAGHERLQQIEKERSVGGSVGAAVAHIPAILLEGAGAGKALHLGGKALGALGRAVRGVPAAAPVVGTAAAGGVEQASRLARVGRYAGRVAATTPLMPSMYLAEAGRRAAQNGGQWDDAQNVVPAYAMGMATVAVLGSLQKFVTTGSFARKAVGKTLVGMGEQQAVDASAQAFSDAVLDKAWKVETGYGLAGDVFRAAQGKDNNAVKHALSQAAVFGIFSAMHARGPRDRAVERGAEIPADLAAELARMRAAGFEAMADRAARDFAAAAEKVQQAEQGPTREAAEEAFKDVPEPLKPVADKITSRLPTAEDLAARLGTTPDRALAALSRGDPAVARFAREAPEPVRAKPPTPDPAAVEPVPDAPVPADPVAVLGEAAVRAFAPAVGLKRTANLDRILRAIGGSASTRARVDAAVARKLAPAETPPTLDPKTAEVVSQDTPAPAWADAVAARLGKDRAWVEANADKPLVRAARVEADPDMALREVGTADHRLPDARKMGAGHAVEFDVKNMAGLTKALGSPEASAALAERFAEAVRAELLAAGATEARVYRAGGDKMADEYGALAKGIDKTGVDIALARANQRIAAIAAEAGVADVPHTKAGRAPGTGIQAGAAEFKAGADPRAAFQEASEASKAEPAPPTLDFVLAEERVLPGVMEKAGLKDSGDDPFYRTVAVGAGEGRRTIDVQYNPDANTIRLDFAGGERGESLTDVPAAARPGTTTIFRHLRAIAAAAREAGVKIDYAAEPNRHAVYARGLVAAGYQLASKEQGFRSERDAAGNEVRADTPFAVYTWEPTGTPGRVGARTPRMTAAERAAVVAERNAAAPPTLDPAPSRLEQMKAAQAKRGGVTREAAWGGEPENVVRMPDPPVSAPDPLAQVVKAAREMDAAGVMPTPERTTLRAALDALPERELTYEEKQQRYVLEGRAAGKTLEQIAAEGHADGGLAKKKGVKGYGAPYARQRVEQIERAALKKLGLEKADVAAEPEAEKAEREARLIAGREEITAEKVGGGEARAARVWQEARDAIENDITRLEDEHTAILETRQLTDAETADFVGRFEALNDRLEGRSRAPRGAGGGDRADRGGEGTPPAAAEPAPVTKTARTADATGKKYDPVMRDVVAEAEAATGPDRQAFDTAFAGLTGYRTGSPPPAEYAANQLARRLASAYTQALNLGVGDAQLPGLVRAMRRVGVEWDSGPAGSVVPFDGAKHVAAQAVSDGQSVRVRTPGLLLNDGDGGYRLAKAAVEPVPAPAPAGRTPWQEEQYRKRLAAEAERLAAEQKVVEEKAAARRRAGLKETSESKDAEGTLRSWVAGESAGRLRLTDLSRNLNKFEDRDQLERYLREKKLGLDTLAADAEAAGLIRVRPGEQAEDVMWQMLKDDARLGESEFAGAELEALDRDARERAEQEASRKEQLAEFEYQEWKLKKEIADEKKTGLGGRGRLERLTDKLAQVEHEISKLKRGPVEYTPGDADIPLAGGPSAPPRPGATPPTLDLVTPARLNAEVNARFGRLTGARDYRAEPKLPGGADARADLTQRATTTSKQADQDPFVTLEEAAHHLAWNKGKGIETDPAKLPAGVPEGLAEMNAVFGRAYQNPRTNVVEGYASWAKLRAAGMDGNLTGKAKAAAAWAETWTRDNGLMGPIDAVTPLFTKFHAQSPTERAQAFGSSTGKPVVADRTPGEIAAGAKERFLDDIDNDLYPAERLEAAVRAAGGRVDPDKAPSTILAAARTGDAAAKAAAWARDGVPVMAADGRLQKHGPSVAEIEAGGRPEWLAPGPDGSASKAGAYHTARGVVSMRENAYRLRDAALAELRRYEQVRDAATGALRESLNKSVDRVRREYQRTLKETEPMIDRVPEEMYRTYKDALAEWRADPDFGPWAEEFSKKLTAGFDAQLDFMVSIGEKTADEVQRLRSLYPDYTPTERVLGADEGWNVKIPGKKGEKAPNLSRKASGSGEAIVDPRLVYSQRLLKFAEVYNRNRAFRAFYELALQPGAGPFLQVYEREAGTRTERGLEASETLRAAGVRAEDIPAALRHMEVGDAEVYFRREPWPDDGRKPSLEGKIDGVLTSLRVGDRALYDLATNQQVDAHQAARLVRAVANLEVFGFQPVKAQAQVVRTLATAANAGFQVRNVTPFRDPLTFWRNTIDRASVRELPGEYWKTYGRLLRQFTGNLGVWTKANAPGVARLLGVKGTGSNVGGEDPLWRAFVDARGDQLKQFAFERDNPAKAYNGIETAPTARSLVKDLLNFMGAGELAPRFLEWKNKAREVTGKSVAELRAEYADYYDSLKAGRKPKAPLTPGQEALLLNAAWEVTSPFPRQGTVTRQFNQITPFFGPAVSGVSKAIRNWKDNPKGALLALGALAAARTLHWLLVKDEKWYGELSAHDKFNNFVIPTPMGPRRIPGPRDLDVAVGGSLVGMLDMADKKDPKFRQLLEQSVEAVLPPGVGPAVGDAVKGDVGMGLARAAAFPAGPVGTVGVELMMNKDWTGKPILPRRDEGKTTGFEQFRDHYGPYALKQLTGGRGELSLSGAGLNPIPRVGNLRASVDSLYERVRELEVEKAAAQRAGKRFPREAELNRLESARKQIEALAREGRGERKVGTRVVTGSRPDGDARQEIQLRQAEIAKRALGK